MLHFYQVKVFDLKSSVEDAVLVMGTDGLWDVISGEEVKSTVFSVLNQCRKDDPKRFAFIYFVPIKNNFQSMHFIIH